MVASTSVPVSNNGVTHENEKRRKQTVERAKANHLSRQLQMRLQYARLKVDHGWQKQNLNEVENLYFHHSHHQRGPKPYASPPMMVTTTSPPMATTGLPTMVSSTSDTTVPPPPTTGTTTSPAVVASTSQSTVSTTSGGLSSASSGITKGPWYQIPREPDPPPSMISFKLGPSSLSEQLYKMSESPRGRRRNAKSPAAEDPGASKTQPPSTSERASSSTTGAVSRNDTMPTSNSLAPARGAAPQAASSNHYPNVYRQPQTQPQSSTSTVDNSFSYSSVSLTYDSFWSSHSSAASHSFRTSPPSTTAPATEAESSTMASDAAMSNTYQATTTSVQGGQRRIAARATAGRAG